MTVADAVAVADLQRSAFPAPFPEDLLWKAEHVVRHCEIFAAGQFVVTVEDEIVASCTNCLVSDARWAAHLPWEQSIVDLYLSGHEEVGTTLYGVDVTVHPEHRRQGLARLLYSARFELVGTLGLTRFGTVCRMPDYQNDSHGRSPVEFARAVVSGSAADRTLSPLLRLDMRFVGVIEGYMDDIESGNAGAILEWNR